MYPIFTIIITIFSGLCYILGKYFPLFYNFVSFYWREEDLPERVGKYFIDIYKKENTEELLNITLYSIIFAMYIKQNKEIVGNMLNYYKE